MNVEIFDSRIHGGFKLSDHFTVKEFRCTGSNIIVVSPKLIETLEKIRAIVGCPLIINSGYRSEAHNTKVKGATYSQHLYGYAADITAKCGVNALYAAAERVLAGGGGLGKYSSFVHVDVRDKPSRWNG